MASKLSPREKAALATQMMSKVVPPSSSPVPNLTEIPSRQINSVQIGLAMAGQGSKVTDLEKRLSESELNAKHAQEQLSAVNSEWNGILPTKKIDPKLIKPSKWANRHDDSFSSGAFEAFREEIRSQDGNVQPIKVRPLAGPHTNEFEIVFGHRRHRACLELGIDVLAVVEPITDQALFQEMDRENRLREDLRPYEQGLMYKRALDDNLYPSLTKLADAIGAQKSNVSTAITIASLPDALLKAFPSPLDIQYRWGAPLADLFKTDPDLVLSRSAALFNERQAGISCSAADVFKKIIGTNIDRSKSVSHVVEHDGEPVFTVSVSKLKVNIELPYLSKSVLAKVEKAILKSLEGEGVLR
jgi:ParB family chromosome partitioning protein